jgi:hypothetical protein
MFMHSQKSKAGKAAFSIATSTLRHLQKEKQQQPKSQKEQVRFILKKKKKLMIKFIQIGKYNQTTNFSRPFRLKISKPGPITQLRFEQVSNPNFSRPFGLRISKLGRITQIEIWSKFQIPIFPDRLDSGFPNRFGLPKLRFAQVQIPILPDRLDEFPNRFDYPN